MRSIFKSKNFIRVATSWPVANAYNEVLSKGFLFDLETFRQDFPGSPHSDTQTIVCRIADDDNYLEAAMSNLECADTEAYDILPSVRQLILGLMSVVGGERIGRVMVVRLSPGGHVTAHHDEGSYHEYYDRFHIVLNSSGCHFRTGSQYVKMETGEVWWFRNTEEHEVWNDSDQPRDHIIVDLKLRGDKVC